MFALGLTFVAYYGLLLFSDLTRPQPLGLRLDVGPAGAIVRAVAPDSPAAQAGLAACAKVRAAIKAPKGVNAPFAALTAIEGAMLLPFDDGSVRERELFADCVVSTESKALRHLFLSLIHI